MLIAAIAASSSLCRRLSTAATGLEVTGERVALNGHSWNLLWLRDNCRCPACWFSETGQRRSDTQRTLDDATASRVDSARLSDGELVIDWADRHVSRYALDWLTHWALKSRGTSSSSSSSSSSPRFLWQAADFERRPLPQLSVHDVVHSQTGVQRWLGLLQQYGFVIINGVNNDVESMRRVVEKIAPPYQSMFGDVWDISQREAQPVWDAEHRDTAYSNEPIGPHTDGCYTWSPPGVQFFQIAETARSGGTNYFVDGFKVAQLMRQQYPADYQLLTRTPISYHYDDSDLSHHLQATHPIFQHDESGALLRVHFNDYDRLPFSCPPDDMSSLYRAYGRALGLFNQPDNQLRLLLKPDQLLATDNWRVLHARDSFLGSRRLMGAYIDRDALTRLALVTQKHAAQHGQPLDASVVH